MTAGAVTGRAGPVDDTGLDAAMRIRPAVPLSLAVMLATLVGLGLWVRIPVLEPLPVVDVTGGAPVVALTDRVPLSYLDKGPVRVQTGVSGWRAGRLVAVAGPGGDAGLATVELRDGLPADMSGQAVRVVAELPARPVLHVVLDAVGEGF